MNHEDHLRASIIKERSIHRVAVSLILEARDKTEAVANLAWLYNMDYDDARAIIDEMS